MISVIISISSVLLSVISLLISFYIYRASRVDTSYLEIDKQYTELLKIGLNDPDLRDYEMTSSFYKPSADNAFIKKYNIYAYMCWNLVETIYDRQKDKKGRFKLSETWIPVLFEENRLHYTWYKHNLRLFKPEFQRFVTSELNDIEIIEGAIDDLKEVYARLKKDFASDERKDKNHIEMLMVKKKYKLLLAKHKIFNEIIGYAFIYEIENLKVLWLDYMSIDIKFQNAGYGTLLFNKIADLKKDGILGIFFEVEIPSPDSPCYNDQIRRIQFYERLGAHKLDFEYIFPSDNGGLPMYLYFKPVSNGKLLPKEIIKESISSAYDYIHSDVIQRDNFLKTFLFNVPDTYFH